MTEGIVLDVLTSNGYARRLCVSCGSPFWSVDPARDRCGDTPCVEYSFLGKPAIRGSYALDSMREAYLSFFEKRGHTRVARYPVVARWRDDVFLVNASIYDFQPHVTSGAVPPPANPLTISQPSIRLTDLDSVGRSGRHTSNFEMMAHHVFNSKEHEVYWKERTVELCRELLLSFGIPEGSVSYKENPWSGGGNAGAALEVLVEGLELATLVFMDLAMDPTGTFEVKGDRYRPMDLRVVDTGYGLERFLWMSTGTPTIYDTLYPDVVGKLFDLAGVVPPSKADSKIWSEMARLSGMMSVDTATKLRSVRAQLVRRLAEHGIAITLEELEAKSAPAEAVYAVADHARCIALLLGDDLVPSNAKAGYLVRHVIRKTLRHMETLGIATPLHEIVFLHAKNLRGVMDLEEKADRFQRILTLETERYHETVQKGIRYVQRLAGDAKGSAKGGEGGTIPVEKLIELYDTHGIRPELVARVAGEQGLTVDVPDGFDVLVAQRHAAPTAAEKDGGGLTEGRTSALFDGAVPNDLTERQLGGDTLPATRLRYYEDTWLFETDATVLFRSGNLVVLDQTVFYPEGGGQPCDLGELASADGTTARVVDVQKVGSLVVHAVHPKDSDAFPAPAGTRVHGTIDAVRRTGHVRHHTGTHIVLQSARRVLGDHVWQAGAQKGATSARVDITHYARVTHDERRAIEELANRIVVTGLPVTKTEMTRGDAEKRYGFRLYQGGPPATKSLRVVAVGDFDIQGCGGTHARTSHEVGFIKILRTERIQDGVVRIEFAAGESAVQRALEHDHILTHSAEILDVPVDQLPKAAQRFFDEWKQARKETEQLRARLGAASAGAAGEQVAGVTLVARTVEGSRQDLLAALKGYTERPDAGPAVIWLANPSGEFVGSAAKSPIDLKKLAQETLAQFEGSGGGRPSFVQGRVKGDLVVKFLEAARERTRRQLEQQAGATPG